MNNKLNIVFFGTPNFAEIILKRLIDANYKPALVVTAPDRPIGRKQKLTSPPVKILAKKNNIAILQPEKLNEAVSYKLKAKSWDLFIVAAYGKILPKKLLDIPKHSALNVHPSLLPKLRGSSPVQYALLRDNKITGSTIMLLDEKMDHGPILAQQKLKILDLDTTENLSIKLAEHGAQLLIETIPKWLNNKIKRKEQDHDKATYTKTITREDGCIDWQKSAKEIENMFRAFTPWPGIFTYLDGKRLKILSLKTKKSTEATESGKVIKYNNSFAVETKKGILIPQYVQLEGKTPQKARTFLNGHPEIIEKRIL